jgi:hypothetical protein
MSEDATTKPTMETILERINALGEKFDAHRSDIETKFDSLRDDIETRLGNFRAEVETRLDNFREEVGIRLDRIEGVTNQVRAEVLTLRADFRELRLSIKEPAQS